MNDKFPDYKTFENEILNNIEDSYFPILAHSLYKQLNYPNCESRRLTQEQFNKLLIKNKFVALINDVYRTRVSTKGLEIINDRLSKIDDFEDYETSLLAFKECNPRKQKNGEIKYVNAFSLGTKVMHFYNPEENPILDSVVRDNLKIDEMSCEICLNFKDAANEFVEKHQDDFKSFHSSDAIKSEFEERGLTTAFPQMAILDMALYSY
jgi:hypothetical protein